MPCHPECISNCSSCTSGGITGPNTFLGNPPSSDHDGQLEDSRPQSTMLNIHIITDLRAPLGTAEGFIQPCSVPVNPAYTSLTVNEPRRHRKHWPFLPIDENADGDSEPPPQSSNNIGSHFDGHQVLGNIAHSVRVNSDLDQRLTPPAAHTSAISSTHASLGRPVSLRETPGNWDLVHIDCLRGNINLLSAAQKTIRLQIVRRNAERIGNGPVASGSYGAVWKGRLFTPDPQSPWGGREIEVAIKVIRVKDDDYVRLLKHLFREIVPLSGLPPHPNILSVKGYLLQGNSAWIMSAWQKRGNARDYISKHKIDKLKLVSDIVEGLRYLHTRELPIVHGDLKLDNVLIGDDYTAMLTDFGLSRIMDESPETTLTTSSLIRGSIYFLAPEILAGVKRSPESDIWALGGLLLQIATGKPPFYLMNKNSIIAHLYHKGTPIMSTDGPFSHKNILLPIIQRCWEINPSNRPTASEIASFLI